METGNTRTTTIGLLQARANADKNANLSHAMERIRSAAEGGAQIICLQELFLTPYFCKSEDPLHFDLAEPVPGPTTRTLAELARELGVVIIASLFEKRSSAVYHNTTAVIDADGRFLGSYRKHHIPEDPGFNEKYYFTPGDGGYRTWHTAFGSIAVLICWDQWFPEAARLAALSGAKILFFPTAIGWLAEEKAELGSAQHTAWETVQRGHAVANGCYIAAVNRVGVEENTEFWGQSFVSNPYGEIMARASSDDEETLIVRCDLDALEEFRRIWPFFRDRRIDTYSDLAKRWIDNEDGSRS